MLPALHRQPLVKKITAPGARLMLGVSLFWLPLSMLSDGFNSLLLPARLLGEAQDASKATTLGLLTFGGLLAALLVQPFAGELADRARRGPGRRAVLIAGTALLAPALAVFGEAPGIVGLAVGYLLVQVAAGVAQAAFQGLLPDLVPQQLRGLASGLRGLFDLGGALLAFVLFGQLLASGSVRPALLAIAALSVVVLALTLALVAEPTCIPHTSPSSWRTFELGVARHPVFWRLVFARFLFLLATYAVGRFLLFFVADRLVLAPGEAAKQAGGLLATLTLLTALGSLPAGWAADRLGRVPLMFAGAGLSAIGVSLLTVAGNSGQILLFGGLMALGSACFSTANWAMTADAAPADQAGRYLGLANAGTVGGSACAGLFGPLVDFGNGAAPGSGYLALFAVATLVFLASAVPLLRLPVLGRAPAAVAVLTSAVDG